MNLFEAILILVVLIIISAIISSAEISLAGARKLKLQQLANEGNIKASQVLKLQEQPGRFITVVQIGLNMVAILGGVIGESVVSPFVYSLLSQYSQAEWIANASSWLAFIFVTVAFILFADLIPKRLAMTNPESIALRTVGIMTLFIALLKPLVWLFDTIANALFKLFKIPTIREENMTSEDIFAVVDAGAQAGIVKEQEQYLIENIFEMQQRTVTSTMTTRENIVFLDQTFNQDEVLAPIKENPHSKLLICDEDFAVIVNEYALVVGIVTLNDVMSIVMGELVSNEEEQIVQRNEHSWLIDGATPLEDVMRALDISQFPNAENYETIGGFMMYVLRKIPKKTDFVLWDKYKFEIIDTDNFKIDQLMVSIRNDLD